MVKWADTEKERQDRKVRKALLEASTLQTASRQHQSIYGALPMSYVPAYNGYGYQVCWILIWNGSCSEVFSFYIAVSYLKEYFSPLVLVLNSEGTFMSISAFLCRHRVLLDLCVIAYHNCRINKPFLI